VGHGPHSPHGSGAYGQEISKTLSIGLSLLSTEGGAVF